MGIARNLRRLARKQDAVAAKKPQRKAMMEPLEPRLLLSADLNPDAADALADGVQQFGDRVDTFMQDDVFDTNLPFIVQVQQQGETAELVAPTLDTLFAVPVDPDGEGGSGPIAALQALDVGPGDRGGDEKVDAGEFIQGWFFDKINPDDFLNDLNEDGYINTIDFMTYIFNLDNSITINMPGSTPDITVTFNVISASDLTGDVPVADLLFDVDFTLTVSQDMQIDLGTEADALKLEAFTGTYDGASGTYDTKATPLIPIDAALEFGFTFGVRTSGQQSDGQTLNEYDFFIRKADDLNVSAKTHDINIPEDPDDDSTTVDNYGFNLNIGFLGAYVSNGTINYQAQISTLLIDSDSPEVLGFSVDQYGDEETSGIVTGFNAIDSEDLAHDAGFVLRIGNAGIATQVTVTADATNNVLNDLLLDVNSTLGTVGLGGLVTASLVADTDPETGEDITKLQFNLVETTATEFGFASEMYNADGILSAVPTDLEFNSNQSFLLSIGGALPALVEVRFPDPAQTDIGFGTSQAAILPDLVGENTPNFSGNLYEELLIGDLLIPDFSANFTLVVTKSDGFSLTRDVSVTESLSTPDPNVSIANLVSDINQALTNEGLSTLVQAKVSGDKIALYRVSDVVSCIEVTAADAVTQNDIGFEVGQITTLTLTAEDEVSNPSFNDDNDRTDDSANIQLTIKTSSGTVTEIVSVAPGSTTEAALAAAIDTALSDAGFAINATYDSDLDKIVLIAQDASILAFSIKTINDDIGDLVGDVNRALAQAGIDTKVEATTDGTNLFLTSIGSSAGKSLEITHTLTLDAGVTYTELQTPPAFGGTSTEDLFSPSVDEEHSNIFFNLPVHVVNGLNYDPSYVTIAGSFSPFGELLHNNDPDTYPEPVAIYDDTGETSRFKIDFDLDPEIEEQDSPYTIALDTSTLDEKAVLYNMAEPLNFNLITSESMIGLLQNLGAALQDLAESGVFAAYDIPYVDATWADLLNFSDSDKYVFSGLVDRSLIYETNGTGVDVSDDDPETPEDDANRLLMRVVDDNGTSDKDDDTVYLVPTFETAQQLAVRLSYILGVGLIGDGGINANYVPDGTGSGDPEDGVNELTYEIYLTSGGRTIVDLDAVPFEYDVALDDFSKLTLTATVDEEELANQQVALQGFTGLNMTFGIDLSPPGAVIYDDTEIANLNGGEGVDIKTEYALTGDTGVITALSSDAHIYIAIDPDEYTLFSTQVEIEAADTVGNIAAQDYADSINTAMANTVYGSGYLSDYVFAKVIDGKLALEAIGSASTIEVFAGSQTDTAWTELGFSPVGIVGDTVEALKAPTPQVGRLSDDAVFTIDIEGDNNGPYTVTVPENSTVWKKMVKGSFVTYGNNTISDLVSDVNNALAATDIGNALGFLAEQSVEGDTLYAEFNAQLSFSRPVVFSVSVNGGEYVSVEVAPDNYAGINALITAVHEGLVTAGLNEDIMAMASGSKILLTAASTGGLGSSDRKQGFIGVKLP
ncbi:MAG: LEPR-XLL domain-containing protein [Desulfobacterales bacterium]